MGGATSESIVRQAQPGLDLCGTLDRTLLSHLGMVYRLLLWSTLCKAVCLEGPWHLAWSAGWRILTDQVWSAWSGHGSPSVVNPGNSHSFLVRYMNEVLVSSPRGGI